MIRERALHEDKPGDDCQERGAVLRALPESAEHLVDDIIIADTGSADRTKEIARNAGALVLEYEWTDDFSAARNFALDHSDGDWNLVLDADETLRPYTRKGLEERISGCGLHTDRRGWEPLQDMIPTMTVTESVSASLIQGFSPGHKVWGNHP